MNRISHYKLSIFDLNKMVLNVSVFFALIITNAIAFLFLPNSCFTSYVKYTMLISKYKHVFPYERTNVNCLTAVNWRFPKLIYHNIL